MIKFDDVTKENIEEHNRNCPQIPDHPHRIMNHQPDIDKIYLYAKDPYEVKYQFLINKRECNPNKKPKILIVFYDMIADMLSNKKVIQ